jgi:hypothetical protein
MLLEVLPRGGYNPRKVLNSGQQDKTEMRKIAIWTIGTFAAMVMGCAGQREGDTLTELCLVSVNARTVLEEAEEVLGQMHFQVEKSDAEAGYLRTRPLRGGQFFEFWRKDNAGACNAAEANLHTVRRTVEMETKEKGGNLCVTCSVKTERLSLPAGEVDVSTRAYGMFTKSEGRMQRLELRERQKEQMEWVELGEDRMLANVILQGLEGRLTGANRQ